MPLHAYQVRLPSMSLPFTYPNCMTLEQVQAAEDFLPQLTNYQEDPDVPSVPLFNHIQESFERRKFDLSRAVETLIHQTNFIAEYSATLFLLDTPFVYTEKIHWKQCFCSAAQSWRLAMRNQPVKNCAVLIQNFVNVVGCPLNLHAFTSEMIGIILELLNDVKSTTSIPMLIGTLEDLRDAVQVFGFTQLMRLSNVPDFVNILSAMRNYQILNDTCWSQWVQWCDRRITVVRRISHIVLTIEPLLNQATVKQSMLHSVISSSDRRLLEIFITFVVVTETNRKIRESIEQHVKDQLGVANHPQRYLISKERLSELYDAWDVRAMYSYVWDHMIQCTTP